jgi:sensor histidine kinase YesM
MVYTAFIGGLMYFYGEFRLHYLIEAFLFISLFILFTHGWRYLIIRNDWFSSRFNELIPKVIGFSIILSVLFFPVSVVNAVAWETVTWAEAFESANIIYQLSFFTLLFLTWSLIYFLFHYISSYQRTLKMTALMNEAELKYLKSQLNPHFLFNALNSVRALVDEDPQKAKKSITALSGLLRMSLVTSKKKLVPLFEELQTVKDYLSLEHIRFEERLSVHIDCARDTLHRKVPPMMLQTIVENGIKHGISNLKEGGEIDIRSFLENDRLHLEIRNTGRYVNGKSSKSGGLGLKLSKKRLEILYDKEASLSIQNEGANTVLTEIIIPKPKSDENINH